MPRWFKFWAKYGFAHAIVPEEEYVYMEDGGRKDNDNIRETAHEWASNTLNGQIILDTGYRRFKYGFRRVNKLPADVRDEKIKQYLTGWSWQLPEARCSV